MPRRSLYILLPVCGVLAALLAFAVASPYVDTLDKTGIPPSDPAASYSTGTLWDVVAHVVFGGLLIGSFALAIRTLEQGVRRGLVAGLVGVAVGAAVVPLANSGSDLIGIASDRANGFRGLVGAVAWCAIVPTTVAYCLALVLGMTPQRSTRAFMASVVGFFACLVVQFAVGPALVVSMMLASPSAALPSMDGQATLRSGLPQWQAMDIVIGITMGLLFALAQDRFRSAWVRLVAGRNEFRDWNLDFLVNRIGTQEGLEVVIRGSHGVAPLHAEIVRQADGFLFRDLAGGTALNGVPVQQAWLRNGDHLAIGQVVLVFGCKTGGAATQPRPSPNGTRQAAPFRLAAPVAVPDMVAETTVEHLLSDGFGQVHVLTEGVTSIGRDPSNAVAVTWDERVSRFHGEFSCGPMGATYRDLDSSNGSSVNGEPVSVATLNPGDVIEIGATVLRYDRCSLGKG